MNLPAKERIIDALLKERCLGAPENDAAFLTGLESSLDEVDKQRASRPRPRPRPRPRRRRGTRKWIAVAAVLTLTLAAISLTLHNRKRGWEPVSDEFLAAELARNESLKYPGF